MPSPMRRASACRDAENELFDHGCDLVEAAAGIRRGLASHQAVRAVPALLGCVEAAVAELRAASALLTTLSIEAGVPRDAAMARRAERMARGVGQPPDRPRRCRGDRRCRPGFGRAGHPPRPVAHRPIPPDRVERVTEPGGRRHDGQRAGGRWRPAPLTASRRARATSVPGPRTLTPKARAGASCQPGTGSPKTGTAAASSREPRVLGRGWRPICRPVASALWTGALPRTSARTSHRARSQ